MKKKILSMAIAIITAGAVMSAQTPQTTDNTTKTEQAGKRGDKKEKKGDKKDDKKGDKKMDRQGRPGQRPNLFEGIDLTTEQQTALKNLREQDKQAGEQAKKDRKAMDQKAREERMAQRDAELKKILTPEQYTKYQANVEAMKAKRDQKQGK